MSQLLKVSLRQNAIFVPELAITPEQLKITETTGMLVANLSKSGFGISEELLHALNKTAPAYQAKVSATVEEVLGVTKNWTPLVKDWDKPTGESVTDHIITFFANLFQTKGTKLMCGHIIPPNTFPLERYNGCPFCGTPFEAGEIENFKQGSHVKVLELWTSQHIKDYLNDLLTSNTALDATQIDSLKILLSELLLPDVTIKMKETVMAVIETLTSQGKSNQAQAFLSSPTDILRYLWYQHTGFLQIIEPKALVTRIAKNHRHISLSQDNSVRARIVSKASLKLKYSRKDCFTVATWINNLDMQVEKICEMMHPKRSMWIRFIRALRLAEYSKKIGFEKLKEVLDKFYKQEYEVWQGKLNQNRLRYDAGITFGLLKQRPGMFARSLFANMLWFGSETTTTAFTEIIDKIPARLMLTLNMYADNYFDMENKRIVKPLGGANKSIPANALLSMYNKEQLEAMKAEIKQLCMLAMKKRFAALENTSKTMYIDPVLFQIPVSIGDRISNVQDVSAALMGIRFPVEGNTVRIFMQWGNGLPAQHLDMDLSCSISYTGKSEFCSFGALVATGCKHSGDIRNIPNMIGTAEYIDINIDTLQNAGAKYVTFTCNAYSNGSISPNLVVGWMNSKYPMKISETTGVAYDPSCVQHQVRVGSNLSKGLVFGVLDVKQNEIIWLEMPFSGQLVQNMSTDNIENLIRKLNSKLRIGQLLKVKAEAQLMQIIDSPDADEVYTSQWAMNTAGVTQLLVD